MQVRALRWNGRRGREKIMYCFVLLQGEDGYEEMTIVVAKRNIDRINFITMDGDHMSSYPTHFCIGTITQLLLFFYSMAMHRHSTGVFKYASCSTFFKLFTIFTQLSNYVYVAAKQNISKCTEGHISVALWIWEKLNIQIKKLVAMSIAKLEMQASF